MKKYTLFETSIIGFFTGVVISVYLAYLNSIGAFVGKIVYWVSLMPVFDLWNNPLKESLVVQFVFVVIVFTVYGVLVGVLFRFVQKEKYIILVLLLILLAGILEQSMTKTKLVPNVDNLPVVAAVVRSMPKIDESPKQYFGNEVIGDLNGDSKNDVAFVILREDEERGTLYYLTTALSIETGHIGTNLIYLGEKMDPRSLNITDGKIGFEYADMLDKVSTSTKFIYAKISEGKLVKVE